MPAEGVELSPDAKILTRDQVMSIRLFNSALDMAFGDCLSFTRCQKSETYRW